MQLYSVMNVKNLKHFKPSMLDEDKDVSTIIPSMDELQLGQEQLLDSNIILETKTIETRHGAKERYRIGRKNQFASKAKWYTREAGATAFPALFP